MSLKQTLSDALPDLSQHALEDLATLAQQTADPQAVADQAQKFMERHSRDPEVGRALLQALSEKAWRRRLVQGWGQSPFLSHLLLRWPIFLQDWLRHEDFEQLQISQNGLSRSLEQSDSRQEAMAVLRRFKQREYLRIGLMDLAGEATLSQVTRHLSDVADACLETAYRWLDGGLSRRFAPPRIKTRNGSRPCRFVVLGMGKLGGFELNYSSDIDLIVLFDDDGLEPGVGGIAHRVDPGWLVFPGRSAPAPGRRQRRYVHLLRLGGNLL